MKILDISFENVAKVLISNLEDRDSSEDPGTHEKIILKCILKKYNFRVWT
jgi:hypothetical protein